MLAAVATSRAPIFRRESTLATMIQDTPNHIFNIGELTKLIASQLVLISRKSTVNLACAVTVGALKNRSSALWETQSTLCALLESLPGGKWDFEHPEFCKHVVCGLDLLSEG